MRIRGFLKENSMSANDIFAFKLAVSHTLQENFSGHKFAMALHSHQNNPHIHVLINKRNIFTGKKIHFDKREDIKEFFNKIRDDYTNELNELGFNYVNKNCMQKDLSTEIKKASKALQNDYDTDYKIRNIYDNIRQNLEKDYLNKHKRSQALLEQIDEKNAKRAQLWQLFTQYKNKNNKKFYKYNKELKELHTEILSLIDLFQKEQNDIKDFNKKLGVINNSANEHYYKHTEGNYKILKNFCNEFEKKYLKTANKSTRDFYLKAKNELDLLKDNLDNTLLQNVDSALVYSKLFCKKENSFDMIKKLDLLEKNAYALKGCDFLTMDEKEKYEKMFENNNKILKDMLNARFEKISKMVNEKGLEKSSFIYKEYEKAGKFLGKITPPKIQNSIKQEKINQNYNYCTPNTNTESQNRGFSR